MYTVSLFMAWHIFILFYFYLLVSIYLDSLCTRFERVNCTWRLMKPGRSYPQLPVWCKAHPALWKKNVLKAYLRQSLIYLSSKITRLNVPWKLWRFLPRNVFIIEFKEEPLCFRILVSSVGGSLMTYTCQLRECHQNFDSSTWKCFSFPNTTRRSNDKYHF